MSDIANTAPSASLPPHESPLPRERSEIEADISASTDRDFMLFMEVLLDIRDLQAECAWRLSEISAERAPYNAPRDPRFDLGDTK